MHAIRTRHTAVIALVSAAVAVVFLWCHVPTLHAHEAPGALNAGLSRTALVLPGPSPLHGTDHAAAPDCGTVVSARGAPDSPPEPPVWLAGPASLPPAPLVLALASAGSADAGTSPLRPHASLVAQAVLIRI